MVRGLKAKLRARRDLNRKLAAEDRANRCANHYCRRSLLTQPIHQRLGDGRRFCSADCLEACAP